MQRIAAVDPAAATGKQKALFDGIRRKLGQVPNMYRALGASPAALQAQLGFAQALAGGGLDARLRESVALAVAAANGCRYCASAHTALGRALGVGDAELADNLAGRSADPRTAAALRFAGAVVAKRGWVDEGDLAAVRTAGFADGEIVEIFANVAANLFTNYFNHLAGPEIDFPVVDLPAEGGARAAA